MAQGSKDRDGSRRTLKHSRERARRVLHQRAVIAQAVRRQAEDDEYVWMAQRLQAVDLLDELRVGVPSEILDVEATDHEWFLIAIQRRAEEAAHRPALEAPLQLQAIPANNAVPLNHLLESQLLCLLLWLCLPRRSFPPPIVKCGCALGRLCSLSLL